MDRHHCERCSGIYAFCQMIIVRAEETQRGVSFPPRHIRPRLRQGSVMSTDVRFTPKADIRTQSRDVRFVPKADIDAPDKEYERRFVVSAPSVGGDNIS